MRWAASEGGAERSTRWGEIEEESVGWRCSIGGGGDGWLVCVRSRVPVGGERGGR